MLAEQLGDRDAVPQESLWTASTLGTLMLASAARHAEQTALWVEGTALSYGELIRYARRIAAALLENALAIDDAGRRCVVLARRSLTAFVGILGAVIAGATYVPLSPKHARTRLAGHLETAAADAIIVGDECHDLLRELLAGSSRRLLIIMPTASAVPDWACAMPQHRFLCRRDLEGAADTEAAVGNANDGAYLLFTSGSTGRPKGVLVRQRNVMAYLQNAAKRYAPGPEDRFSQLFDLTFDLSVHDMFLCWGAGAALYCPTDSGRMAPRDFVRQHDLTFWFSTPSTAAFMWRLQMLRPDDFPSLRWGLFCGEALPRRLVEAWVKAAPNATVENLFGPTEATIAITAFRLPDNRRWLTELPETVPIGRPLPDQRTMILRADGHPALDGEAGELCLAGSQVTDGYWQQPELTAERFIRVTPDAAGEVWYRTGDRVRMDPAHGLLFLGRLDRQVKILGHRVELEEVEAALRRGAACDSVAAIAWPVDGDGLARGIVGFVAESGASNEAIIAACRRTLPPYMIPALVHRVADWPLTSNGKTDYTRLRRLTERSTAMERA
jgi:amino acid adenylation domain-containing protein